MVNFCNVFLYSMDKVCYLAPRSVDYDSYNRIVKDIGAHNKYLLNWFFSSKEINLVREELYQDPVLKPVFLVIPEGLEEFSGENIYNRQLFYEYGGKDFFEEYSGFCVGNTDVVEKVLKEDKLKIIVGVTDRAYDNNLHREYKVSNNRQCYYPLENGLWLGVKGVGQLGEEDNPLYYYSYKFEDFRGIMMQSETENFKLSSFKKSINSFPQIIVSRKLNFLPDGNGGFIPAKDLGLARKEDTVLKESEYPVLSFSLFLTPHRFNHLPHILKYDSDLRNTRKRLKKAVRAIDSGIQDVEDVFSSNSNYLKYIVNNWGKLEAIKINKGLTKLSLHPQDKELGGGGEADDSEYIKAESVVSSFDQIVFEVLYQFHILHQILSIGDGKIFIFQLKRDYMMSFFQGYFSKLSDPEIFRMWMNVKDDKQKIDNAIYDLLDNLLSLTDGKMPRYLTVTVKKYKDLILSVLKEIEHKGSEDILQST